MSKASAQRTIRFIGKAGTLTAYITCPQGDIWQTWEQSGHDGTTPLYVYRPHFTAENNKKLTMVVSSSSATFTDEDILGCEWKLNNIPITFGSNGNSQASSGLPANLFKQDTNNNNQLIHTSITLQGDIAAATIVARAMANISCTATINTKNGHTATITAHYPIRISEYTGSSHIVTIALASNDTSNFSFTQKKQDITLEAIVYAANGNREPAGAYTYEWYYNAGTANDGTFGSHNQHEGKDGEPHKLVINEAAVYGATIVFVRVKKNGQEVGTDIQAISDNTDPYIVDPRPSPADETIIEGENNSVTYRPRIITREQDGGENGLMPTMRYNFTALSPTGNVLNVAQQNTALASFAVTAEMATQAAGDITLLITTASNVD